jgi:ATP-dependent helicase/nuclease subunit A
LLVSDTQVLVVDFKTGRRVPRQIDQAPTSHLRQMSAYAALLRGIFPGRTVKAALLYTNGPVLMQLSDELIEAHKPRLQAQQDNLSAAS